MKELVKKSFTLFYCLLLMVVNLVYFSIKSVKDTDDSNIKISKFQKHSLTDSVSNTYHSQVTQHASLNIH